MSLTERSIQRRLFYERRAGTRILLPNYTPRGWWECDVWAVTKSGYVQEYEIKLTVADFRADTRKERIKWTTTEGGNWAPCPESKHAFLSSGNTDGPVQFWYCVPVGLLSGETVPPWAGLMEFEENKHGGAKLVSRTDGPRLHGEKVKPLIVEHALSVCYWRYWNARNDHDDYVRDAKDMRRFSE